MSPRERSAKEDALEQQEVTFEITAGYIHAKRVDKTQYQVELL
jgi:hypothetical protein